MVLSRPATEVASLAGPDARALGFACPEMLELPWVRDLPEPEDLSPDLNKFRVFSAVTTLLRNRGEHADACRKKVHTSPH